MKDKANEKYDILCVGACVQDILLEGLEEKHFKNPVTTLVLTESYFTSGMPPMRQSS